MNTRAILIAIISAVIATTGTACATDPVAQVSDSSSLTVDGLRPVTNSRLDEAFAVPGLDLSPYTKVMVAPGDISYHRDSYELTDRQVAMMSRYFGEALIDELEEGGYSLVNSAGPDVLLVEVDIVDLMVNRPTEPSVGRTTIFTATSGEMTLAGKLRDSTSGELLARFEDRQRPRSYWSRSTSVSEWSEARRAFDFWAEILRERLDAFHDRSS